MADKQDAMPTHSDQDEYRVEQEEVVDADSDDGAGSDGVRSSTSLDRFVMRSEADQQTSSACAAAAPPVEFDYSQRTLMIPMHDRKSMQSPTTTTSESTLSSLATGSPSSWSCPTSRRSS